MRSDPCPAIVGCRSGKRVPSRWRDRFIEALAQTSCVASSARHAGISVTRAYRARRSEPDFARDWLGALGKGYEDLELEVLRRLKEGDLVTQQGAKYDFASAIRLLGLHRGTVESSRKEQHAVSADEIRNSIERKIEDIRRRSENRETGEAKAR